MFWLKGIKRCLRRRLQLSLMVLVFAALFPDSSYSIEVRNGGHYLKVFHSFQLESECFFDAAGTERSFDDDGRASFEQTVTEYRFGVTNRWNVGFKIPSVVNSFENRFGTDEEKAISDFVGIAEYRFLTLPWVMAVRGEVAVPLDSESPSGLWVGNGTTDLLVGLELKRFLFGGKFYRLWLDAGVGYRSVVHEGSSAAARAANIDGSWSVPYRGAVNFRPFKQLTVIAGAVGSHNEKREFTAIEAGLKYRLNYFIELEIIGSRLVKGRNSTSASAWLIGISVNTNRLWN